MSETSLILPPGEFPAKLTATLRILLVVGIFMLLAGIFGFASERVWLSYLINFCFWSGLAQAGVVFSAAYRLTIGRWGETIRRVSEGFILFIPLSIFLFLLTFLGRHHLWPWIEEPIEAKAAWLNETFFFFRVTFYFLVLSIISLLYVRASIRPEIGLLKEKGLVPASFWVDWITAGWRDFNREREDCEQKLSRLVPVMLIAYGAIYAFVGFDVVMSLEPHWYSTMYGWLYFAHAFDAGVAATIIVAILARKYFHLEEMVSTKQFYDVSRLLMGLCMLAGGFYWSQYLVTWYGNLGEEIERFILRFSHDPWPPFQWAVIILLYFFPIVIFLSRSVKERPRMLLVIATIILVANWFYHFIEIAPSVWKDPAPPLGLIEISITLGYAGAVGLCWLAYARVVPLASAASATSEQLHERGRRA